VATALLTAIHGPRVEPSVTLAANHLVRVVLLGQKTQSRLDDTTTETQNQVKGGLFLNVVIGESTAILKLLASEDQTLLIWRNTFLVLDLSLDILDGVGGLHLEGDGLAREGFDENLHSDSFFKRFSSGKTAEGNY